MMKKLSSKALKWLRVLHILSISVWFGGTACVAGLSYVALFQSTETEFMPVAHLIAFIYQKVLGPMAVLTLLEGVIYGCWSKWGFFKQRWLLLKWICVPLIIVFIGVGGIGQLMAIQSKIDSGSFSGGFTDGTLLLVFVTLQILLLMLMTWLSVFKPQKKATANKPVTPGGSNAQ